MPAYLCMYHSDDDPHEAGMSSEEWFAYHGETTRDNHPEQF